MNFESAVKKLCPILTITPMHQSPELINALADVKA
jgi:hypothetical protein